MKHTRWIAVLALAGAWIGLDQGAAAGCDTPLVKSGVTAAGSTVSATVANPTLKSASGYLWIEVTLANGIRGLASVPVTVPPQSSTTAGASFPVMLEQIGSVEICRYPPGGITETPDPVIVLIPPTEPVEDGNGED